MGKRIKINDFKFRYGQEIMHVNVYAIFKYTKNNDKYIIYSYDNTKLYYGSVFIRDKELVVMQSNKINIDLVEEYINNIFNNKDDNKFEELSLDNIESIQLIEENIFTKTVDINKLYEITMPKEEIRSKVETKNKKKNISISVIFFTIFIILIIAFFFFNPEVLIGEDSTVTCTNSYNHKSLPSTVNEEIVLVFNGKEKLKSSTIKNDYVFNNKEYYDKFKKDGLFYKYMSEGDTYKFIDEDSTYRIINKTDDMEKFELAKEKDKLIKYYQNKKYNCQ